MIRKNLLKVVMLGLCLASLSSGSAFAMATVSETPVAGTEEISPELQKLYNKQKEVDRVLFEEHAKDIEGMGFIVSSTGVMENAVEISISPYEEKFADYIYELVGKDGIKVTEMDESMLYASGAAEDQPVADVVNDAEVIMDKAVGEAKDADLADNSGVTDKDEKMEIQVESISNLDDKGIDSGVTQKDNVSAPIIILTIAVIAALVGGSLILSMRKKNMK